MSEVTAPPTEPQPLSQVAAIVNLRPLSSSNLAIPTFKLPAVELLHLLKLCNEANKHRIHSSPTYSFTLYLFDNKQESPLPIFVFACLFVCQRAFAKTRPHEPELLAKLLSDSNDHHFEDRFLSMKASGDFVSTKKMRLRKSWFLRDVNEAVAHLYYI